MRGLASTLQCQVPRCPLRLRPASAWHGGLLCAAPWHELLATPDGPIVTPESLTPEAFASGDVGHVLEQLLSERPVSVNAAAS
jgi:hypothetical protein